MRADFKLLTALLSTCGPRRTVNFSILFGNGIGPRTCAPVRLAVETISAVLASNTRKSNAFSRMRIFWLCIRKRLSWASRFKKSSSRGEYPGYWCRVSDYSMMLETTPEPTVRPPSRIAKRRPCSMAIGEISSTENLRLSPGITISVSAGSSTVPVTSVVRK